MTYFSKNVKLLAIIYLGSLSNLAKELGVSKQAISQMLKDNNPKLSTLLKLHEIFNISLDDLIFKELSVK